MPGMYAVTSVAEVSRTRATFRRAELGFFGVKVYTRVQTPRRWGEPRSAGLFVLLRGDRRPLLTSCCVVGIPVPSSLYPLPGPGPAGNSPSVPLERRVNSAAHLGPRQTIRV